MCIRAVLACEHAIHLEGSPAVFFREPHNLFFHVVQLPAQDVDT